MAFQSIGRASKSVAGVQLPPSIDLATAERQDLRARIVQATGKLETNPPSTTSHQSWALQFADELLFGASDLESDTTGKLPALFGDTCSWILELQAAVRAGSSEPLAKRRKLEGSTGASQQSNGASGPGQADSSASLVLDSKWSAATAFEGVSFAVPQRKKLLLEISTRKDEGIRALNPAAGKQVEFGIPWKHIEYVVCTPVPEKAQASRNFCIFPIGGSGILDPSTAGEENSSTYEPIVWSAPDTKAKGEAEDALTLSSSMVQTLRAAKTVAVLEPNEKEFVSQLSSARKGEKSYHVKAFRGTKDGFLFFLSQGLVWGFKKPLLFFAFSSIESISYTSVLQRTFNLAISARPPSNASAEPIEFEFSMIDQADYAGIDEYVRRHALQDASMAEQRRAKKLNINGVKGEGDDGEGGADEEEESELKKAEREAEMQADDDEDDEDDENFDPGSEGESEGSGTSDDSDDDDDDDNNDDDGDDDDDKRKKSKKPKEKDLVADELGSEAEDVSASEEEEGEEENE